MDFDETAIDVDFQFRRVGPASNASAGPPCVQVNGGPARLSCRLCRPTPLCDSSEQGTFFRLLNVD